MATSASRILVYGGDEFIVSTKAREIAESIIPKADRDMGLEIIDGGADTVDAAVQIIRRCHEAVATPAFLSERKLVWLKGATFLSDTVTGKSESVKVPLGRLMDYVKDELPQGHSLLISSPKVDKRYTVYKTMKACGEVHDFSVSDNQRDIEKHAADQLGMLLKKTELRMAGAVRVAFLDRVGSDTRQMLCELEKMATYLGDRKDVTLDDVRAITSASREAIAWDISDAFGSRKLAEALDILNMLMAQKQSPIGVAAILGTRVRDLMLYREALDAGWIRSGGGGLTWNELPPDVDAVLKNGFERDPRTTHPYRAKILADQAARFTMLELRRIQREFVQAHTKLVSSSLPQRLVLELALTRALHRPAPLS